MIQLGELYDVDGGLGDVETRNADLDLLVGICPQLQEPLRTESGSACVLISHLRGWIERAVSHDLAGEMVQCV